jgi:hypothetical protein
MAAQHMDKSHAVRRILGFTRAKQIRNVLLPTV